MRGLQALGQRRQKAGVCRQLGKHSVSLTSLLSKAPRLRYCAPAVLGALAAPVAGYRLGQAVPRPPSRSAASWRRCGRRRKRWASRAPPSMRRCAASSRITTLPDLVLPGKELKGQAEFTETSAEYLSAPYLAKLGAQGKALQVQHAAWLDKIERELGVQPQFVLAIWGRETAFGVHRSPLLRDQGARHSGLSRAPQGHVPHRAFVCAEDAPGRRAHA